LGGLLGWNTTTERERGERERGREREGERDRERGRERASGDMLVGDRAVDLTYWKYCALELEFLAKVEWIDSTQPRLVYIGAS